jgi:hypothetical protein
MCITLSTMQKVNYTKSSVQTFNICVCIAG